MKSLHECQDAAWKNLTASVKAAGGELPEHYRSAVNLVVLELYNTLKAIPAPRSAIEVKFGEWRKRLARWSVPLMVVGGLWLGTQIGRGEDLSDLYMWVFFGGVAAVAWYLAEYGIKNGKK